VLTRSTGTFLTRAPINVISTSNLNSSPTPSTACFSKPSNASAAAAKSTKTVGLCRYLDEVSDLVDNQGLKEDDPKVNKQYEKKCDGVGAKDMRYSSPTARSAWLRLLRQGRRRLKKELEKEVKKNQT